MIIWRITPAQTKKILAELGVTRDLGEFVEIDITPEAATVTVYKRKPE